MLSLLSLLIEHWQSLMWLRRSGPLVAASITLVRCRLWCRTILTAEFRLGRSGFPAQTSLLSDLRFLSEKSSASLFTVRENRKRLSPKSSHPTEPSRAHLVELHPD